MPDQLRITRQLAADHWMTECRACPTSRQPHRRNPKHGDTQQAVDTWWAWHVTTEVHKQAILDDGSKRREEERILSAIFGTEPKPVRDNTTLSGQRVIHRDADGKKHSSLYVDDNPKRQTPPPETDTE